MSIITSDYWLARVLQGSWGLIQVCICLAVITAVGVLVLYAIQPILKGLIL